MAISLYAHCVAAYDELCRLRMVKPIPTEIEKMEERTAGGIVKKIKAVIDSQYFKDLPEHKKIRSGLNPNYVWKKAEAEAEANRIWDECKNAL